MEKTELIIIGHLVMKSEYILIISSFSTPFPFSVFSICTGNIRILTPKIIIHSPQNEHTESLSSYDKYNTHTYKELTKRTGISNPQRTFKTKFPNSKMQP